MMHPWGQNLSIILKSPEIPGFFVRNQIFLKKGKKSVDKWYDVGKSLASPTNTRNRGTPPGPRNRPNGIAAGALGHSRPWLSGRPIRFSRQGP
jgi:hypothetical protein